MEKEKQVITRQTGILESMEINPYAMEILMEAGLGCVSCAFSQMESIEDGLLAHGFTDESIDLIVEELNKTIEEGL